RQARDARLAGVRGPRRRPAPPGARTHAGGRSSGVLERGRRPGRRDETPSPQPPDREAAHAGRPLGPLSRPPATDPGGAGPGRARRLLPPRRPGGGAKTPPAPPADRDASPPRTPPRHRCSFEELEDRTLLSTGSPPARGGPYLTPGSSWSHAGTVTPRAPLVY